MVGRIAKKNKLFQKYLQYHASAELQRTKPGTPAFANMLEAHQLKDLFRKD